MSLLAHRGMVACAFSQLNNFAAAGIAGAPLLLSHQRISDLVVRSSTPIEVIKSETPFLG